MTSKGKRTRGPRSCDQCRISKQRCEQLDIAAIQPSNEPQPLEMACRRCRVLQLPCIVADMLPKSTRMRIERAAAAGSQGVMQKGSTSRHQGQCDAVLSTQYSSPNNSAGDMQNAPWTTSATQASSNSPSSVSGSASGGRSTLSAAQHTFDPQTLAGVAASPSSSLPSGSHRVVQSFREDSSSHLSGRSSSASRAAEQTVDRNAQPSEIRTPRSIDWLYRAKVAMRPIDLIAHLSAPHSSKSSGASSAQVWAKRTNRLPDLSNVVRHILADTYRCQQTSRLLRSIQDTSMPFLPFLEDLLNTDDADSAFLLAVSITLACSDLPKDQDEIIKANIVHRCVRALEEPPLHIWAICSLLLISIHCPHLIPSTCQHGLPELDGYNLLLVCAKSAGSLGLPLAFNQMRREFSSRDAGFADLGGHLFTSVSLAIFIEHQLVVSELLGDNDQQDPQDKMEMISPNSHMYASLGSTEYQMRLLNASSCAADLDLFKQCLENSLKDCQNYRTSSAQARRLCGSHLFLILRARSSLKFVGVMRDLLAQLIEQQAIWRSASEESRVSAATVAFRRWHEHAIATLTDESTKKTQDLRHFVTLVGNLGACSAVTMSLVELDLAMFEYGAISKLKAMMYDAGVTITGPRKTSQDFLYGLFAIPSLLRTFAEMGVFRTNCAKQVLLLLGGLTSQLQMPSKRVNHSRLDRKDVYASVSPKPSLSDVFGTLPVVRWCGVILSCATTLAEEIAGRFLAQEPPIGPQNESRFEVYSFLLSQCFFMITNLSEETRARHHRADMQLDGRLEQQIFGQMHLPDIIDVSIQSILNMINSLARWRKQATGIGHYETTIDTEALRTAGANEEPLQITFSPSRSHAPKRPATDISSLLQEQDFTTQWRTGHDVGTSANSSNDNEEHSYAFNGTHATDVVPRYGGTSRNLPVSRPETVYHEQSKPSAEATSISSSGSDQFTFGDALLADILFTPIETFFTAS